MLSAPNITYVGHATVLIEMNGMRILTDPVLRHRLGLLRHRRTVIAPADYDNIDAVLISHVHLDHLDIPSLRLVEKGTPIIVPQGTRKLLHRRGFRNIVEMHIGDSMNIGSISVRSTYAHHGGTRYLFGTRADSMGYIIDGSHSIYFAGDTDLFPEMADLSDDLDLALLPIWGWGPTLSKGHLNPYSAAEALRLLSPRFAIPIHWGTLHPLGMGWMKPRFLYDPPDDFVRHAATIAPDVKIHVVKPGSIVDISGDYRLDAPA
ncbi:MAG: MBL fold metallo-hydrolase [Thermodesulfobacteriota bacterium]